MFDVVLLVVWGGWATGFGWIVATDFRGAAVYFALPRSRDPFTDLPARSPGIGFVRTAAGVFALVGPVVLVLASLEAWRGVGGPGSASPPPGWALAGAAGTAGAALGWAWRRSGALRRAWRAGDDRERAAAAGLTAAVGAFVTVAVAASGPLRAAGLATSWLVCGVCGIVLLSSGGVLLTGEHGGTDADPPEQ
ncbi:hypothetical protein [Streptomyces sp. NPDC049906]|uniref:hypothetical protein n=1 Tax=Streptomyces sp. NPDC049906 TaxID=3155656 RepID=UPI0034128E37